MAHDYILYRVLVAKKTIFGLRKYGHGRADMLGTHSGESEATSLKELAGRNPIWAGDRVIAYSGPPIHEERGSFIPKIRTRATPKDLANFVDAQPSD